MKLGITKEHVFVAECGVQPQQQRILLVSAIAGRCVDVEVPTCAENVRLDATVTLVISRVVINPPRQLSIDAVDTGSLLELRVALR